ncbi:tyrosine-type recombinase/integrase [Aeromonas dhakensis]|uniref:tyrosine-type recombinase/integrase n=1 Tax=Aeromonas dhakensis TaxID=196024 RepID=UPI003DA230BA
MSTVATYGHKLSIRLGHSPFWTFHDLRRSLATHLTAAGIAPHVIEIIAGHSLKGGHESLYSRPPAIRAKSHP